MTFWIITSLMALSAAFLIALALLRVRSDGDPAAASDLQVYRDQLKDVDRDLARGVIAPEDAERIRTEVSRRILAADAKLTQSGHQAGQPRAVTLGAAAAAGIVVIGGAMALYQALGAPGYPDVGLSQRIAAAQERSAARPRQTEAEARMPAYVEPEIDPAYAELIARLRTTVAERGDDLQGLGLLAEHEANLGNYVAAHAAKARQIALKGAQSTAIDHAELAEMLIAAAGGYVSPEAEEHLQQALSRDPWVGPARYYWGLMLMQNDRPDLAFRIWEQTLRAGPPTAPWIAPIRDGLPEAAWRAGVEYELPPAASAPPAAPPLSGPSAEDVAAAQDLSTEDRAAMIQGMVEQLSDRLATEGGSAQEWARLIGALDVLGQTERATAIYDEAQQVFADAPQALAIIQAAARQAGLTQ